MADCSQHSIFWYIFLFGRNRGKKSRDVVDIFGKKWGPCFSRNRKLVVVERSVLSLTTADHNCVQVRFAACSNVITDMQMPWSVMDLLFLKKNPVHLRSKMNSERLLCIFGRKTLLQFYQSMIYQLLATTKEMQMWEGWNKKKRWCKRFRIPSIVLPKKADVFLSIGEAKYMFVFKTQGKTLPMQNFKTC